MAKYQVNNLSRKRFDRLKKIRKKNNPAKRRFVVLAVASLFLVVGVVYLMFFSSIFKIADIKISGLNDKLRERVMGIVKQEMSGHILLFLPRESIFLLTSRQIVDKALVQYPEIKKLSVHKQLPAGLTLDITERQPIGLWCALNGENCFLISDDGVVFRKMEAGQTADGLITIVDKSGGDGNPRLGQEIIKPNVIAAIVNIHNILNKHLSIPIEDFELTGVNALTVKTREGWRVYLDLSGDYESALAKLRFILENEIATEKRKTIEYIDLRFSKVYYK